MAEEKKARLEEATTVIKRRWLRRYNSQIQEKSSQYKSIDKKLYAAIAGFTGADKALESAKKNGVFLLTLSEEHQPTLVNSEVSPTSY